MLSSLPIIAPRDSHSLWYTRSSYTTPSCHSQSYGGDQTSVNVYPVHEHQFRVRAAGLSPLAQLALDEQSVDQRKLNIQQFGAQWIRPPGMSKTLQGELDEKAEREEADHQERMDDGDLPVAAEFVVDGDEDGDEHDLDADIPVAESDFDDEDEDIAGGESFADGEVADEERDLDGDIPEAETEVLWDDSDDSTGQSTAIEESMREGSGGISGLDESPQQATFSHDEVWPEPGRANPRGYDWRARSRYRQDMDDSMEVDSDE